MVPRTHRSTASRRRMNAGAQRLAAKQASERGRPDRCHPVGRGRKSRSVGIATPRPTVCSLRAWPAEVVRLARRSRDPCASTSAGSVLTPASLWVSSGQDAGLRSVRLGGVSERIGSAEGGDARERLAEDQRVDLVRALVGEHATRGCWRGASPGTRRDAVGAEDRARLAGDLDAPRARC